MTGRGDVFEFEGFCLDLRRMGVWKDDERVPLEPKALDVLCHLVANRDRLVSKDELLDKVWKDTFVTPNALTRAIAQLRKALGDGVDHPKLIETVAKRGYRFVAAVTIPVNGGGAEVPEVAPAALPMTRPRFPRTAGAIAIGVLLAGVLTLGWRVATPRPTRGPTALDVSPLTSYGDVVD